MVLPISLPVVTRRVLDHSICDTLDRCMRLGLYKYGMNRKSEDEDGTSLDFGSHYHTYREYQEKFYQEAPNSPPIALHLGALQKAKEGFVDPPLEHKKSYLDTLRLTKSCEAAHARIIQERLTGSHKILHVEVSFELPLPSGRPYGGRLDQVVEWNKRLWIRDFKTTSWFPSNAAEKYQISHQMSGYVWALKQLSGRNVDGVLVEVLHNTSSEIAKIKPLMTTRTDADITGFIEWAETMWDRYEAALASGNWPMSTRSCFDYNVKCPFFNCCSAGDYTAVETWLNQHSKEHNWDFANKED